MYLDSVLLRDVHWAPARIARGVLICSTIDERGRQHEGVRVLVRGVLVSG